MSTLIVNRWLIHADELAALRRRGQGGSKRARELVKAMTRLESAMREWERSDVIAWVRQRKTVT